MRKLPLSASYDSLVEKLWRTDMFTKSLRPMFYAKSFHNETDDMISAEKKVSIDNNFIEIQHRPVLKAKLCSTLKSTWRKGV